MTILKNHWKLLGGPLISLPLLLLPFENTLQLYTLCFSATIVFWWMTEAIPVAVTSLLIPCFFFMIKLASFEELLLNFAHPLIFLFMGGFFVAKAMEKTKLDERLALSILNLPFIHGNSKRTLITMILTTAFLSMWLSNTATAAIMLGISIGVIKELQGLSKKGQSFFIMSIAYAANIGGVATKVGSTPNILASGFLHQLAQIDISFFDWILKATPVTAFVLLTLIILTMKANKDLPEKQELKTIQDKLSKLGVIKRSEYFAFAVISLIIFFWVLPGFLDLILGSKNQLAITAKKNLPESFVALFGSTFFFLLPGDKGKKILDWETAKTIDWGTLLLFGGGLCLGFAWDRSTFLATLSEHVNNMAGHLPLSIVFIILASATIFLSEVLSNTACANIIIPVVIHWAKLKNTDPIVPTMAVTFAASLAFMLPIGTPPNAMAYGTGKVDRKEMYKLGFMLNLASIVAISLFILLTK